MVLLALATAAWSSRRGPRLLRRLTRTVSSAMRPVRRLHSGDVRDHVTWLVMGTGVLGGVVTLVVIR